MNAARKKDKHGVIGTMLCLHADVPTSERRQEEEEVGKVSGVKGHVSNWAPSSDGGLREYSDVYIIIM